ncbi:primosomal protein N' [Chloroflexia bacterium SDU3-3]|nr:primosomal protein N' [Chloroflexia bacterium SDU3-3]
MPPELLADVAVHVSIPDADPIFTYRAPARLRQHIRPGRLVWVPLRRKRVQGVVLDTYPNDEGGGAAYREIDDLADPEAALTEPQIALARWLAAYYSVPTYEALALMLPPGVSQESEPVYRASAAGLASDLGGLPEAERAVLYLLRQLGPTREAELRQRLRGGDGELREIYRALAERGLIARESATTRAKARPRIERMVRLLADPAQREAALAELQRAPRQQAALRHLAEQAADGQIYPTTQLYAQTGANLTALRALEQRGLVELSELEVRRDPLAGDATPPDMPPALTVAQEAVWRPIAQALEQADERGDRTFLLHGVTGSGKTEIYLRAIARAMRRGRQALVLVPEIALTTQLVRRFAARFPGQLAVLHSGLGMGERYDEWRRLRRGEARLAIGSRSAVFAPLPELGLIIVDEEHEPTFKHDSSPRYHAREAARTLARLTDSVLILGSATPSVESYQAALDGRYTLLRLAERVGSGRDALGLPRSVALPLPPVQLVDMRRELEKGNRSIFSRALQQGLLRTLERGQQAILFINRRGAASFVMCRDCGHVISCPNCSSPLTLHHEEPSQGGIQRLAGDELSSSILVCHGCNHRATTPPFCPECFSTRIKSFGVGTQRVVEEVAALFPQARPLRWDRDTVTKKGDHERLLDAFLEHRADVLVGTQMIAKGLDLPLVSLVGVVAADTGLHLPDFRAGERSFQLLTQVAGRAGRRQADAQVVIQTYDPEHYALQAAQEHDYQAFFTQEIAYRKQTRYPPFSRLVRFIYSGASDTRSRAAAQALAIEVEQQATALGMRGWAIIGPAPAFFHRQRNRFRWHLLLRCDDPAPLLAVLRPPPGWVVDIDPAHVL